MSKKCQKLKQRFLFAFLEAFTHSLHFEKTQFSIETIQKKKLKKTLKIQKKNRQKKNFF